MSISALDRESSRKWKYDVIDVGFNYRLDEIRASLGFSQLKRLNQINKMRKQIAEKYDNKLKNVKGIVIPKKKKNRNHIYHLYTIKIEKDYPLTRNELFDALSSKGIGTSVQYYPLHLMSYMKNYSTKSKSQFKNSNILKNQVLSLPIFPSMNERQIEFVSNTIKNYSN